MCFTSAPRKIFQICPATSGFQTLFGSVLLLLFARPLINLFLALQDTKVEFLDKSEINKKNRQKKNLVSSAFCRMFLLFFLHTAQYMYTWNGSLFPFLSGKGKKVGGGGPVPTKIPFLFPGNVASGHEGFKRRWVEDRRVTCGHREARNFPLFFRGKKGNVR